MTFTTSTFANNLRIPKDDDKSREVALQLGQNLALGALLGKLQFKTGSITPGGGNTGDGTIPSITLLTGAKQGNYLLKCIVAATNGGIFSVESPDSRALPNAEVAVAYTSELSFTIGDGATDYIVGDSFTLAVDAHTDQGQYVQSNPASVDGSETPDLILLSATDATLASVVTIGLEVGSVNELELVLGGHTLAGIREGLRVKGLLLVEDAIPKEQV